MSPTQRNDLSVAALVINMLLSGVTLNYVRETEHRITRVEMQLMQIACEHKAASCK